MGSQLIGRKFGQYRVVERLGRGSMGSVYRATDEMLGRDVALKILDTSMDGATARFRAEAAALARLSHPGIAAVHELVEDDGHLVMAMEYVRGQTLQQILEQVGVFSPRRAADLCMQALAALEHAHTAGVTHRDLKPGNLMLTESGAIKIMDFGIARLEGTVFLTSAGAMLGTPAYMAPEQVLGHPVDARTDLYAMGVVFFRLVTGALPFKADNPFDMAQAQVNDVPARASDERADLPEWVDTILTRALAKKPADRFQLAMEFHEAFARAIADSPQPIVTAVPEATEAMPRPDFGPPVVPAADAIEAHADESAPPTDVKPVPVRRLHPQWLTAAAGAAFIGAVWLSSPSALAPSDTSAPPAAALLEPAPQTSSALPAEPELGAVPRDRAVAIAPASFTTNAAADRANKPAKAASTPEVRALPAVAFHDVKMLAVNGTRTTTSDVVVEFSGSDVTVHAASSKTASATLPYGSIAKATYARGRDPKWDPALSGPPEKLDVPGILGRAKHWLVLQSADGYVVLRLDGANWNELMKAFEERARIVIDRSATVKKSN